MKFVVFVLITFHLMMDGCAYQQCNIICDNDQSVPSPVASSNPLRGKAGPRGEIGAKGEKGDAAEAVECRASLAEIRGELQQMRSQLSKLQRKPHDCREIKLTHPMLVSGVYTIFPFFNTTSGIQVYCDMETDGGGWIVFQKRQDGSVDFYRGWDDYVNGFGDLYGEFWLGLELLHQLTQNGTFDMRVDLTDFEDNSAYEKYSSFSIGEGTDYELHFDQFNGTAGQSLHRRKFTTKDRDQDRKVFSNCAESYKGAWWYAACHASNLNGLYLRGRTDQHAVGMVWYHWKGYRYSLRTSQMKFRPAAIV